MKPFIAYLSTLSVCAALAGCGDQGALAHPPLPEPELAAAGERSVVPLRGRFAGGGADFSGTLTQLGRFEGVFDAEANTAVWTAADGSTLTNQTTSFVAGEEVSSGVFSYVQELTLTGGTGRFAGASGSATVTGLIDFNTNIYLGWVEGHFSSPDGR